jgi:beta-lactamase class A
MALRTLFDQLRRTGLLACLALLGGAISGPAAADARLPQATAAIETDIAASGTDVAVAFRTLDGRAQWLREPDKSFHAASTMKVAVLIELYRQVQQGRVRLTDSLPVRNQFPSLVDGSPYQLSAEDDSEKELYQAVGSTRTLEQLSVLMITVSSNLATNLLMQKLGVENIRHGVHALGADGMQVLRGLEDSKAFEQGRNNTTTARALMTLMSAIAQGKAVDPDASKAMVALLKRDTFNDRIPAGLPPGTPVAHKTGDITDILHDAAIVYGPRPFVLIVLTHGKLPQAQSAALIARIARQLYQAVEPP